MPGDEGQLTEALLADTRPTAAKAACSRAVAVEDGPSLDSLLFSSTFEQSKSFESLRGSLSAGSCCARSGCRTPTGAQSMLMEPPISASPPRSNAPAPMTHTRSPGRMDEKAEVSSASPMASCITALSVQQRTTQPTCTAQHRLVLTFLSRESQHAGWEGMCSASKMSLRASPKDAVLSTSTRTAGPGRSATLTRSFGIVSARCFFPQPQREDGDNTCSVVLLLTRVCVCP